MDKKMKHNYLVPSVKVVSFKVEDVFTSPLNIGDQNGAVLQSVTNGTETYGSESWTTRPFSTSQE